ncbi:MAG: flavin reductase family protein [Gemmatimonadota bacterium]|nr:flavin reductase family protein [Gemmatimonadota bacterium]MDH5804116.1 flavin reductase family protein [Gemmatimonadota bacterium]
MSETGTNEPAVGPDKYRTLLGAFPTGVTVVTVRGVDGAAKGMTASAVSAVSLVPPILLVCVERSASFHRSISKADHFSLNILAANQENVSRTFAGESKNPFSEVPHFAGPKDLPLLRGTVGHIICHVTDAYQAGDHSVFFGTVIGGEMTDQSPLLHYRGRYAAICTEPDQGANG